MTDNAAILQELQRQVLGDFRKAIIADGHFATGRGMNSIGITWQVRGNDLVMKVHGEQYMKYMNDGVPANKIPFNPGSGKKSSQYIDGLIRHFRFRGLSVDEATRAAFATARVHKGLVSGKRGGMPTAASRRFAKSGKRLGWATDTFKVNFEKYRAITTKFYQDAIYTTIRGTLQSI